MSAAAVKRDRLRILRILFLSVGSRHAVQRFDTATRSKRCGAAEVPSGYAAKVD